MIVDTIEEDTNVFKFEKSLTNKLKYDIDSYSGYTPNFNPRNVMFDKPLDQSSRWATNSSSQSHFITLKLEKMALVQTICFGKFHKSHVCNMKEFKVFGGMSLNGMHEILFGGLHNDSEAETFPLKCVRKGTMFPCKYIKIVPLASHGGNFNTSIWYIELRGITRGDIVETVKFNFNKFKELQAMKLTLKHLRQKNFVHDFHSLLESTKIQLEDPIISRLYINFLLIILVSEGNFNRAENMVMNLKDDVFLDYVSNTPYKPFWRRLDIDHHPDKRPGVRGGHQMCIDPQRQLIYLLGGWDGAKDLSDFWCYSIRMNRWSCISMDTRVDGGPSPRSCHKICFDPKNQCIFVLGRYIDPDIRPTSNLESDFFKYDINTRKWHCITPDTKVSTWFKLYVEK
ncbi:muskelin 1, intracellular mediator kelch motif-containing protein [Rozella allomycis CSF55]|uniref:Muskelin 1, intracellular mediator kelch motif-containing protein n=1 Tax=Rozella allomycis (strain CSF55) TaxID=988480 RepID=A0A4P9YNE8_ROZAC|nr:muskelin 1, intracellular mediator kelch motif-containing protein [Rozella allomycis CSF55]